MKLIKLLIIVISVYVVLAVLFYIFQSNVFFFPSITSKDFVYAFPIPHEEVFLETSDQETIHALLFERDSAISTILYFHGNAGNLAGWGWIAEDFRDHDYNLMIMDYRTYGKSTGKLSEENLYIDAKLCYDYLINRYPNKEIIIYGRSIGTGIAVDLASKVPVKSLLLESPFTNLPDLAWHHFPVFPYHLLSKFHFRSDRKAYKIDSPVYIFHGTNDNIVPYKFGERLYKKFPSDRATFFSIEGAGHNDLNEFEQFHEALNFALTK